MEESNFRETGRKRTWLPQRGRRGARVPWGLVVPALFMYGLVVLYPAMSATWWGFTDWDGLSEQKNFVGLENFRRFIQDGQALASLKNTFLLAITVTIVQNVIGLLLALGLDANIKSRNFLRTILFAPAVLPPLIVAFLWQYVYSSEGALNRILGVVGLDGLQQNWLGDPKIALWVITATVIWQFAGVSMVIFLAGLQGVPQELKDAAALDGAGAFQKFWNVTRPLIAPATTVNLILSIIGGLKLFDQVFAMTGGGPGYATETLSTVIYKTAFVSGEYGYSTAIALVLTVIVAAISLVQLKILRSQEVEG